jgi:hypothetical protein
VAHRSRIDVPSLVLIASEQDPLRCVLAYEALRRGIHPRVATTPDAASIAAGTPVSRLVLYTDDPTGRAAAEAGQLKTHVINADLASALALHHGVKSLGELALWRTLHALFDALTDGTLNDLAPPFAATASAPLHGSPVSGGPAAECERPCIDDEMIRYRNVVVHLDTPVVLVNDETVAVPPTARAMLIYMLFNFGRAIPLDEFRSKVHRSSLAKKTLHAHMSRLRAALGLAAALIETVREGYGIGLSSGAAR